MKSTTLNNLVFPTNRIDIIIRHPAVLLKKLFIHVAPLERMDELPEILVSGMANPLVRIFEKIQHNLGNATFAVGLSRQFGHVDDDIDAGFSDGPVVGVFGLLDEEGREPVCKKLLGNHLRNGGEMSECLFSHLDTRVVA